MKPSHALFAVLAMYAIAGAIDKHDDKVVKQFQAAQACHQKVIEAASEGSDVPECSKQVALK